MSTAFHRTIFLNGPAGRLEASLWIATPEQSQGRESAGVALVCHPHPLYGGTMHNKVVFRLARTFHRLHMPVLRFNFRGAGLSEGVHDHGGGEAEDVRAALAYLASEFPARAIILAGFSFGAWVGSRVGCKDERVGELVGVGVPANDSDFAYLHACTKPKLIIQGSADQFGSRKAVEVLVATIPEPKRLVVVEGADHFFAGKLDDVGAALTSWMLERHPELF